MFIIQGIRRKNPPCRARIDLLMQTKRDFYFGSLGYCKIC